jgi:hypothetical protein
METDAHSKQQEEMAGFGTGPGKDSESEAWDHGAQAEAEAGWNWAHDTDPEQSSRDGIENIEGLEVESGSEARVFLEQDVSLNCKR